MDVDNLGAARALLFYSVIISHLFQEVGPRYLSNLRRRRRYQRFWALKWSSGIDGWLLPYGARTDKASRRVARYDGALQTKQEVG